MSDLENLQIAMAMHCLQGALETALMRLATLHGNRAGEWLEELEKRVLMDCKNTDFRVPENLDADVTRIAIEFLRKPFNRVRQALGCPER